MHIFSKEFKEKLLSYDRRIAIITDSNVAAIYGERLKKHLGCEIVVFSAGEASKTRETKAQIEDELFELGFGRDSLIIGIGGGVVTDLAGFVAATYCRGVPLISVPTTLLGMCDAAIGGKTGVNLGDAKNFIGTFSEPTELIIDITLLESLKEKHMREGMAEVIKHAAILDSALFDRLKAFQGYKTDFLQTIVERSHEIKNEVVSKDQKEGGYRRILNFGHTVAHAIEALELYEISHGEAVAIGCIVEAKLSDLEAPLIEMFKLYEFPLKFSTRISADKLLDAMMMDKKSVKRTPRFVQLKAIGEVESFNGEYCTEISDTKLRETLDWMIKCHTP
ncbi:MAG: 3-dehydroquinate synthase [Chlamydiia bacterium]|nr:3-dehydroquinate synthase [Chlamydiia bacterium]MCH9615634.1 3-dehydroquinate synthase [Chlamydiia bacterium]MCH9628963.1 3-dehydroquinate synthase [Chlamydiia bacterium]